MEDIHEALINTVLGIRFGLLSVRHPVLPGALDGTDEEMVALARKNALAIGAGHSFILFLGAGYYPINVLPALRNVPENLPHLLRHGNPTQVILADTGGGRGFWVWWMARSPGCEGDEDIAWRKGFLRKIGYKLG